MNKSTSNPRILVVTPEITYLPGGMDISKSGFSAKAGGLADVAAALINALFEMGADVHVALPDYRSIFDSNSAPFNIKQLSKKERRATGDRIHLAEDRLFYDLQAVYSTYREENAKAALAFQREVINTIVPRVKPDLIHCNDWMTGLIPAMSRKMDIQCLFTIHNVHTAKCRMSYIEQQGIDTSSLWPYLFFDSPQLIEDRDSCRVDFLTSGISAAHFVNTVSPTFLREILDGRHPFINQPTRKELLNKMETGCVSAILNAPDASYTPRTDKALVCQYGPEDHVKGKQKNKQFLQESLNLIRDINAPLFFWPSRLDVVQKGCGLMTHILYEVVSSFWEQNLQLVFVADGEFKYQLKNTVQSYNFVERIAVCDFEERLSRLAYAAADFVLMPSLFEPCGLSQMIGAAYGALPVAHKTGGIRDTIRPLDIKKDEGNGFLFENHGSLGLCKAVREAMVFYNKPKNVKRNQIERIMAQSAKNFSPETTARQYIRLYEQMLKRPLINSYAVKPITQSQIFLSKSTNDSDPQRG